MADGVCYGTISLNFLKRERVASWLFGQDGVASVKEAKTKEPLLS
jgi:hypothetical protein